jgi:hypothetical protein
MSPWVTAVEVQYHIMTLMNNQINDLLGFNKVTRRSRDACHGGFMQGV